MGGEGALTLGPSGPGSPMGAESPGSPCTQRVGIELGYNSKYTQ